MIKDMDLSVNLFGKTLKNPVIPASGTFGFGYEFNDYYDINILGSISLKGTTLHPRYGNPLPRIAECPAGMLNSIGLQNPGVDKVISEQVKKLQKTYKNDVIFNVGGDSIDDYVETVTKLNDVNGVLGIELNISCPNVAHGGMAFGVDEKVAAELVKHVKNASKHKIIVKLSPNVTDIVKMAKSVEDAGADAISLINTLVGMRINLKTAKPILSMKSGGYSGSGVFPVALRMVFLCSNAVKVPIIGMGGITNSYDVIEMMYAGASAVMVGTQNLIDPYASKRIIEGLPTVMEELRIQKLQDIIGRSHG